MHLYTPFLDRLYRTFGQGTCCTVFLHWQQRLRLRNQKRAVLRCLQLICKPILSNYSISIILMGHKTTFMHELARTEINPVNATQIYQSATTPSIDKTCLYRGITKILQASGEPRAQRVNKPQIKKEYIPSRQRSMSSSCYNHCIPLGRPSALRRRR